MQRTGFVEPVGQRAAQFLLVVIGSQVGEGRQQIDHAGGRLIEFGGAPPPQPNTYFVGGGHCAQPLVHEFYQPLCPVDLLRHLAGDQSLQQFAKRGVLLVA